MVLWLKEMSSIQEVSGRLRLKPICSANNRPAQVMRLANLEVINLGGKIVKTIIGSDMFFFCFDGWPARLLNDKIFEWTVHIVLFFSPSKLVLIV